MTQDQFKTMKVGDIVRGIHSGEAYVVTSKIGTGEYVGTRTIKLTCPDEWEFWEYDKPKPDPFEEWYNLAALPRRACGYDYDELRKAYMAGMKAKP